MSDTNKAPMSTLAERFKELLRRLSITGKEFAYQAGMSEPEVNQIKTGKKVFSPELRRKIKTAFPNVDVNWLEVGDGKMFIDDPTEPLHGTEFRDRVAICAFQALISRTDYKPDEIASHAYAYADAMIKVREGVKAAPTRKLTVRERT